METSSKKILEALPNFNDYLDIIEEIKALNLKKMQVEAAIKQDEANNFVEVMSNPKYFVSGKAVPVSFYENAYKYGGIDGNLVMLRAEYIRISAELDALKARYDVYRQMQDMYKSIVYAERALT